MLSCIKSTPTTSRLIGLNAFTRPLQRRQPQQLLYGLGGQHRHQVTLTHHDFADNVKIKRPLPIVIVQSSNDLDTKWPKRWQQKLAQLGYRSSHIRLEREDETSSDKSSPLDIWYKDLVQAMREHSYFPPLLIGHGGEAWKTSQKYVCNNPVSGLVLVHPSQQQSDHETTSIAAAMSSLEFEPHFPLLVVSPTSKVPLFLQDEHVDHVDTTLLTIDQEAALQYTLDWMDDVNM